MCGLRSLGPGTRILFLPPFYDPMTKLKAGPFPNTGSQSPDLPILCIMNARPDLLRRVRLGGRRGCSGDKEDRGNAMVFETLVCGVMSMM